MSNSLRTKSHTTPSDFINDAPNITSHISMLPDEVLNGIFSFVGSGNYRYIGGTSRHFRAVYNNEQSRSGNTTFWSAAASSVACAELVLDDLKLLLKKEMDTKYVLERFVLNALKIGNVSVLVWARKQGVMSFDVKLMGAHGQVNVLEWADKTYLYRYWDYYSLLLGASEAGNVNILEWIANSSQHRHAIEKERHKHLLWQHAGEYGHVSILEWMKNHNLVSFHDTSIWWFAAGAGRVNVLDWLFQYGYPMPQNENLIVEQGVSGGNVPVLEWAQNHGGIFTVETCTNAAAYGQLAVLQWLRANECPWNGGVLSAAEDRGHDHVVKWARENGCPEARTELTEGAVYIM